MNFIAHNICFGGVFGVTVNFEGFLSEVAKINRRFINGERRCSESLHLLEFTSGLSVWVILEGEEDEK